MSLQQQINKAKKKGPRRCFIITETDPAGNPTRAEAYENWIPVEIPMAPIPMPPHGNILMLPGQQRSPQMMQPILTIGICKITGRIYMTPARVNKPCDCHSLIGEVEERRPIAHNEGEPGTMGLAGREE